MILSALVCWCMVCGMLYRMSKVQGARCKVQGARCKAQGARHKVQGARCKAHGMLYRMVHGAWCMVVPERPTLAQHLHVLLLPPVYITYFFLSKRLFFCDLELGFELLTTLQ